jgi:hypothetical protein
MLRQSLAYKKARIILIAKRVRFELQMISYTFLINQRKRLVLMTWKRAYQEQKFRLELGLGLELGLELEGERMIETDRE